MHRVSTWKGPYLHHRHIFQILLFLFLLLLPSACKKKPSSSDNHNPPPQEYDPRNISRNDTYSVGPSIAVGPDGTVYVVWMDGGQNEFEFSRLYFRYKPPGGEWSEVEVLTDTTEDAWAPQIAVDPSGNLHLVWDSRLPSHTVAHSEIHYRMRSPSGEWSDVTVLSSTGTALQSRIAVDPSGTVHVVWIQGFGMKYRQKISNGEWSEIETVPVGSTGSDNPYICSDHEGGLHVVYEGGEDDIKYLYRSPTGEWSEPVNVSESRWVYSWYASVAVDEDGKPWVLWTENDGGAGWNTGIIYYAKMMGDTWAQPESIPGTRAGHAWPRGKRLFFYGGKKYLLWGDGYYEIFLGETEGDLDVGVEVRNPFDPPGSPYPEAVLDERRGVIHVVWSAQEEPGNYEIFYDEIPLHF